MPVRGFPIGVAAQDGVVYAATREGASLDGFDEETGARVLGPVELPGDARDVTVVNGVAWATVGGDGVSRASISPRRLRRRRRSTPGPTPAR